LLVVAVVDQFLLAAVHLAWVLAAAVDTAHLPGQVVVAHRLRPHFG
jgi:hypothetical protein